MIIIPLPDPPKPPAAQTAAHSQIAHINAASTQLIAAFVDQHRAFWGHPTVTPAEILAELGTNGMTWLLTARNTLDHIAAAAALIGKTLADVLPLDVLADKLSFQPHADGSVTVIPEDGKDAWGRPLPEPEPEPEPADD
jgi:hypothetical protein